MGNMLSGKRSTLKRDKDTKAVLASSTFFSSTSTNVAKETNDTYACNIHD